MGWVRRHDSANVRALPETFFVAERTQQLTTFAFDLSMPLRLTGLDWPAISFCRLTLVEFSIAWLRALPSERSNMICIDTPRSASLFNAHARKKRDAWYRQPTTLPRPGADAFPLSCTSGCARSDYGTAQRA